MKLKTRVEMMKILQNKDQTIKSNDSQLCDDNAFSDKGWVVLKYEESMFPQFFRKFKPEGQRKMTECQILWDILGKC